MIDPPSVLIQNRQARRMRSLEDRLRLAKLQLARGEEYPKDRLLGGVDPTYVHELPKREWLHVHSRPRVIHKPIYRKVNRPLMIEFGGLYTLSPSAYDNTFLAGQNRPPFPIFDALVINQSPEDIAERISRGETLFQTHQNLEGYSGVSQFLREFTGDVWSEHSTVDVLKLIGQAIFGGPMRDLLGRLSRIKSAVFPVAKITSLEKHMISRGGEYKEGWNIAKAQMSKAKRMRYFDGLAPHICGTVYSPNLNMVMRGVPLSLEEAPTPLKLKVMAAFKKKDISQEDLDKFLYFHEIGHAKHTEIIGVEEMRRLAEDNIRTLEDRVRRIGGRYKYSGKAEETIYRQHITEKYADDFAIRVIREVRSSPRMPTEAANNLQTSNLEGAYMEPPRIKNIEGSKGEANFFPHISHVHINLHDAPINYEVLDREATKKLSRKLRH